MQIKVYINFRTEKDWYFTVRPVELKKDIPSSSVYYAVELDKFIDKLIRTYPGTIQEFAAAVEVREPFILVKLAKGELQLPFIERHNDYRSIQKMIRCYYRYVFGSNPLG